MKRLVAAILFGSLIWSVSSARGDEEAVVPAGPAPDTLTVLGIEAGSRLYPDWKESHQVRIGEIFFLGDTPLVASVREFFPDFRILEGKPVNWSDSLGNPAAHVFVYADTGAVDSSWAFLNFPPHFSPESFFTFRLTEIVGHSGPAAPDSETGSKP